MSDKKTKADYPLVDELLIYGKDLPTPTCQEELACRYSEKPETTPLLVLPDDLEGFRCPPEGIVTVAAHGAGLQYGFGGLIYPPGTFRVNKHTFGKELGVQRTENEIYKHVARENAITAGIIRAFEKNEIAYNGKSTLDVVEALTFYTLDKLMQDDVPVKEQRLAWEFTLKTLVRKTDLVQQNRDRLAEEAMKHAGKSMETVDEAMKALTKMIDSKKAAVVEGKFYDVSSGEETEVVE